MTAKILYGLGSLTGTALRIITSSLMWVTSILFKCLSIGVVFLGLALVTLYALAAALIKTVGESIEFPQR